MREEYVTFQLCIDDRVVKEQHIKRSRDFSRQKKEFVQQHRMFLHNKNWAFYMIIKPKP